MITPSHRRRRRTAAAALAAVTIAAVLGLTARAQRPAAAASRHVVLISLDGFPASALDDPYIPLPTLRALAARGARAKVMRPVNPTVTWPNHTSLVTGVTPAKHGVLFNGILVREPGVPPRVEPWRDKSEMVRVPTLYDVAHRRGLTTAQVDWVAVQNAPTITWSFAERPDPSSAVARELAASGAISAADLESFATRNIVWRDRMWTTAAAHIIRAHRPNLLMFHLLNLDSTHHRYGPRAPAAVTAMTLLDAQVREILDAVRDAGIARRTTIVVVSDHGFRRVKRQIALNAAFTAAGLNTVKDGKLVHCGAYAVPEGGSALVYVTTPDPRGEILARARRAVQAVEGVAEIVEPTDFARYGLPQPDDNPQMGALFVLPEEGYAFTAAVGGAPVVDAAEGALGAHGYVASDPELGAIFIAAGAGIRRGAALESIDNVDVAPTIAALLGIDLGTVDGRAHSEIFGAPR